MDLALHIKRAEGRQQELEGELAAFDFKAAGGDARKFQALTREHQRLVRIRELWRREQDIARQIAEPAANDDLNGHWPRIGNVSHKIGQTTGQRRGDCLQGSIVAAIGGR